MKKYIIGLMAVASLASCSNDEIWTAPVGGQSVINASFEGRAQSRVGFTDATPAVFFWNAGDEISVHTTSTSYPFIIHTLTSGAGTGSAQFQGTLIGEGAKTSICALYPANNGHKYNNNTLTFHLADTYTYANADGQFGLVNGGVSNSTNAPMLAKIATEGSMDLNFKHLGGVFCFQIAKIPAAATKFVFTANTKITGDFEVNMNQETPSISTPETVQTTTTDGEKTVTINFTAGTEKRVFYIPVPTGTYAGFGWEMKDGSDKVLASFKSEASNTVNRADLLKMPLLTCSTVTGGITSSVQDVSDLNTLLQNGATDGTLPTSVTVTSAKDISSAIEIPAAYTSSSTGTDAPKVLNLTFNEVPKVASGSTDGAIEIKESSSAGTTPTESKASIEIAIPTVGSGSEDNAPSFNITLPSATVTLAAAEETTTYNKVVATTATNTLIVDKGVTVKELIVKGGNVSVKKGASITSVKRDESNSNTVTIYKEEGATLPSPIPEGFKVVNADIAGLLNVAENGGTYTLTKDLTGDFTISAKNDVIINLNGHKITNKSGDTFTVNKGSKLTIGGSGTVDNVTHAKACIYNNGTVVLNGGEYTRSKENGSKEDSGGNSYYNILNHGEMTIQPGVMISSSGAFSSLIDNGYYSYTDTNERVGYVEKIGQPNPSLTINGGTFSGGINTIKNDDGATLTIVNGTFTNMTQATVQNNNVAEIRGGEFNPTGSASHAVETKHNTTDYNKGETKISGGTFNGLMYVSGDSPSLTVTGGTFSDPSALTYLGNNADVKVVMNKDYTMGKALNIAEDANVTVDLNSKTLKITNTAIESKIKGTAYFKNGTINTANTFYAQSNGNLTFDNVKVIETRHTAIQAQGPNVKLTVKNNSVITGRYFGISTNASNSGAGQSPTYGQNATIVLENSTFNSEETGFMNNVPAKVTITGCEFSGNHQGGLLRGGDYTIKNSTFTLNASLDEESYAEDSWTAQSGKWADGNRCAFAGITMGNKESNSYQYYTKVAMENVKVKVEGAYASQYPAVYVAANKATDLGVTWTFDTSCVFGTGQTSIEYGSSNNITVNGNAIQPSDK